ncbi:MAG: Uncharacterized protein G01um10142_123 [Parcubacteria group bacterium Gr01-1014_2]|nr:MAG: Uncharacterized protein G01um10142_123 [Parcubacteria group bacterium Gr01-1014_2]
MDNSDCTQRPSEVESKGLIPFIFPEGKPLTKEQKEEQIIAKEQYLDFVAEIEKLLQQYDNGEDDVEYIDEMKPSISKSLQFLWSRFTDSSVYQKILEQSRPIPADILMERKEIESEIESLLKETESDFSLKDVKDAIYYENESDDMMKIVAMFDRGGDASELQNILDLVTEAWNCFPHKILAGLSPAEKLREYDEPKEKKLVH